MSYYDIRNFAKASIINLKRPSKYRFRDRYEHSLRVTKWAERIQISEGGDLEVIRIASILHDIGWKDGINHALVSKELAENYLTTISYDNQKVPIILEAIENHNNRETSEKLHIESFIVMDADILDEVGALSVLWDAMATSYEPDANYYKAYDRIKKSTEEIKKKIRLLRTETGRKLYLERIQFIDAYLRELEYELGI